MMNIDCKIARYYLGFMLLSVLTAHSHMANDIHVETVKVAEGLYMMSGSGGAGNMAVSVGDDGIFLIDG